jgi:hypothetical protein
MNNPSDASHSNVNERESDPKHFMADVNVGSCQNILDFPGKEAYSEF